jgi:hypothetical protein
MGVWQGVAMDSLKFHPYPRCSTLLSPVGRPPLKWFTAVSGVACSQGWWPAAVFYPFGHPTPYAYVGVLQTYLVSLGGFDLSFDARARLALGIGEHRRMAWGVERP